MSEEYEIADEMAVEDEDDGFIKVALHEDADFTEFPKEQDESVLFSTIKAQFPEATGIRYKGPSGAWRAIRDVDNVLKAPKGGWGDRVYCVSLPETVMNSLSESANKRKNVPNDDESSDAKRTRRIDPYLKDMPITGLPFDTTEDDVREYLEKKYGELDLCEIKKDFDTGKSRGFGFVRFKNIEHAKAACNDRHTIGGRPVTIKVKVEHKKSMKLFVGRLPKDLTKDELHDFFSQFGPLQDVLIPNPYKQFAFVTFASIDDAKHVLRCDHEFKGNILNIEECQDYSEKVNRDRRGPPPRDSRDSRDRYNNSSSRGGAGRDGNYTWNGNSSYGGSTRRGDDYSSRKRDDRDRGTSDRGNDLKELLIRALTE